MQRQTIIGRTRGWAARINSKTSVAWRAERPSPFTVIKNWKLPSETTVEKTKTCFISCMVSNLGGVNYTTLNPSLSHFSLNHANMSTGRNTGLKLHIYTTLQMFCMLFLQSYVCQPNPQTTLSNFNSLKPVIKKRQFNAVFTVFQKGFLHVFVCDFWKLFSVISAAYMKPCFHL